MAREKRPLWFYLGVMALTSAALAAGERIHKRRRALQTCRRFRFHAGYRETITLKDGSKVHLRLIRPDDKRLLAEGMRRASLETRYRRFFVPKSVLTDEELRYLTEVDGFNHFAIGAVRGWGKREQGLGIARFVRFRDRPDAADASIVVADETQRKGLGSALFCRLMQAAQERGIQTLRCELLATNIPALRLLHKVAQPVVMHQEGRTVIMEIRIDAGHTGQPSERVYTYT